MSVLTRFSLANRAFVALVAIVVSGFGAVAIPSLRQQMLPDIQLPSASVVAVWPGSAPQIVEAQVTEPIEGAVRGLDHVTKVTSFSRTGSSTVQVQFDYGTDIDDVIGKLEQTVSRLTGQLPAGVTPSVVVGSTQDLPVVQLAAAGEGDEQLLADRLFRAVIPALQSVDGVREATLTGVRTPLVTVTVDVAKLAKAGLTAAAVTNALKANGVMLPGGALTLDAISYPISIGGSYTSLDDLRELPLAPANRPSPPADRPNPPPAAALTPVRLGDVATVEQTQAEATTLTRTDGRPTLGVAVTSIPGADTVGISHAVRDQIPQLESEIGTGGSLTVVFDQAPFVERSIESLTIEGLLGLAFAVLTILVFLLSLRSTLVTAVSIPLSVLIALIALWYGDLSLNLLTLGALTIAVGRVVDDSIVVLENIKRHLGYGEDKRGAIITAVREVASAVTSSTATTVAVFLPMALVGGLVGQLFGPFAWTVTVALVASLVVALTIVPVLAYWFLKPASRSGQDPDTIREQAHQRERRGPLQYAYVPVLRTALRHRTITLILAAAIFAGTIALVPYLKTSFLGSSGQNTVSIIQTMPVGTSLTATDTAAKKIETVLQATPEVQSYQVTVGAFGGRTRGGGGGTSDSAKATFSVTTKLGADVAAVESHLRAQTAALDGVGQVTVGAGASGGLGGSQLQVLVHAPDDSTLRTAAEQVRQAVAATPGTLDVTSDLHPDAPLIDVQVDRVAAARYGLTDTQIGQAVSQAFRGTTVTNVTVDGQSQDVVLRIGAPPSDLDAFKALPLSTAGATVRLDAVAQVRTITVPGQISRIDGVRTATITAAAPANNLGGISADLRQRLDALNLPAGASYTLGGATSDQASAFADLAIALIAAIAIVYLIMMATFRSLVQPLILLVSVPFAATGALGLLLATDRPLGVEALIGLLMLVGIVVTNAIVLLDLVNQHRVAGFGITEALVEGGRQRLRPILMTAVATICALVPMSLGITGGSGFISQPLAIVVIGGLFSSTLLTLILVPVLYSLVEGAKQHLRRRRIHSAAHAEPMAAPPVQTMSSQMEVTK
jgi:hydrophobic/amphiphilic exporter-1 (mainly G- bacteria), HAE1 family